MINPYDFLPETSVEVRMLPNFNKKKEIGHSFKEIKFITIQPKEWDRKTWIRFYSEDSALNLALSMLTSKKLRDGGFRIHNRVLFYGLIEGKIEMISISSNLFNEIQTSLTREIANGKSPLDPKSGVGIVFTTEEKMGLRDIKAKVITDLDPISIGESPEQCIKFLTTRETDMNEYLDQHVIDKHKEKSNIFNYLLSNEDLSKWRQDFRENRLKNLLNKKTDNN